MTALLDTFTKASLIQWWQSSNENIKIVNKTLKIKTNMAVFLECLKITLKGHLTCPEGAAVTTDLG